MRSLTLLFYAVIALLVGVVAAMPAQTMIGIYERNPDDPVAFAWGVWGGVVTVTAIAAPVFFFAAALLRIGRRE